MECSWLDEYLLSFPGAEKDFQPAWKWIRYKVRGKMFAAVCSPGPEYGTYGVHDLASLRCEMSEGEWLQSAYPEILPDFCPDKRTWTPTSWTGNCRGRSCGTCVAGPTA